MSDLGPRRISAGEEPVAGSRRRRSGPGIAVLAVAAYGLVFLAALVILRRESPLFSRAVRARGAVDAPPAELSPPGRAALLAGGGLAPVARERYLSRLAADQCDCGCGLPLRSCLESDQACIRSPELARRRYSAALAAARADAR